MPASLNRCEFIGNLGADPVLRYTQSGKAIATVRLAANDSYTNAQGERQENTEWVRLVMWGKLAEAVAEYLHKGSRVYAAGRLQTRQWEDNDGQRRYMTEVVAVDVQFLETKPKSPDPPSGAEGDDDLPFK